jgi:hypothetical protein
MSFNVKIKTGPTRLNSDYGAKDVKGDNPLS